MPAWSYSALSQFETCPRQYYETRVTKRAVQVETEALRWGNNVHKALENRAKEGTELPTGMAQWEPMMQRLDRLKGRLLAETQIAVTREFKPVSWFDKSVWLRLVIDYGRETDNCVLALDYKTGKPKPDIDQLRLFAGVLLRTNPQLERAITGYVWLKTKQVNQEVFTQDDVQGIWDGFTPRVARLMQAHHENQWPCRPSGLCRGWCPAKACEHYQSR